MSFSSILLSVLLCHCTLSELLENSILLSHFLIHSINLCILIGIFRSVTFNVIIDMHIKSAILLSISLYSYYSFLIFL